MTIHILRHGKALCGGHDVPNWVVMNDPDYFRTVNCSECRRQWYLWSFTSEEMEPEERSHSDDPNRLIEQSNPEPTVARPSHTTPPVEPAEPQTAFERDLECLINRHCQENGSDTPDFILAEFLSKCLEAWNIASRRREAWYGRGLRIGGATEVLGGQEDVPPQDPRQP
jgi:hypothetical protein